MASLKDKTISGVFWSFLQKIGSRGVSFLVMILLARLLTPADFGLIGMLTIFIQVSQAIVEGGFNLALIQKKDTDELDYSSVFWINLVASIVLYLVIYFCAPLIADFYSQPILTSLVRILSIVILVNAFSIVQESRLIKEFRFKTLAITYVPSTIIAGSVAIWMALKGFGVWSLVGYQVINRIAFAVQIWLYSKWKPLITIHWNRIRSLFNFGSKLLISKVIGVLYNNMFLLVIGKFYPVSSVGYYQNSFNLVSVPSGTITSVLNSVTFSAFSSVQDDNSKLKTGYRKVMQQAILWICPAYIFAGVLAEPLFDFVFGVQWLPAVPYFQWLCIVGIITPLNTYNLNIVNVKGRSDIFLKLQLIRRGITIIAIGCVISLGITAMLVVQAASTIFTFILFSNFSGRFIGYPIGKQLQDVIHILITSVVIGAFILAIDLLYLQNYVSIVRLLIGMFFGWSMYLLIAFLFKWSPFIEARHIGKNGLKSLIANRIW